MCRWFCTLLLLAAMAQAQPRCAVVRRGGFEVLAVLEGAYLRLRTAVGLKPLDDVPAPGVRTVVVGNDGELYGARGDRVVRLDGGQWPDVAECESRVQQLLPAPDGSAALVVLTGHDAEPVLAGGRIWRLPLGVGARPRRIEACRDGYRPWRLWPARVDGEARLAVGAWRATRFLPVEHRCHFVFGWHSDEVVPVWLGSRLARPYLDATHADLRGDGSWRMVGLEVGAEGQPSLGVYHAIGFGYDGEWRSGDLPGARRVLTCGEWTWVWGPGAAWRLQAVEDGYRLTPLHPVPPDPEQVLVSQGRLLGWWDSGWHELSTGEARP